MWLLLRSVALAALLAGHVTVTVSWPAAQWVGESESDQWQHGARQKRQEADPVSPVEVREAGDEAPPVESGSGSQEEEATAEEGEGSSEGSGVDIEGTEGSSEGSAEAHESSSEGGSGLDSEVVEEREEDEVLEAKVNAEVEGGAEESGDSEGNQDGSGNHSESSGEPENGHAPGGSGDIEASQDFQSGNSEEDTAVGEEVSVEAEAVLDEVSVEAEAVHGEEGSGDAIAEAEVAGQIGVGNPTDESQVLNDVLDDVEDVEDVDVVEDIENVGSEFVNTTDRGELEYEDGQDSIGEPETSLESPEGTDSGAILCCCICDLS